MKTTYVSPQIYMEEFVSEKMIAISTNDEYADPDREALSKEEQESLDYDFDIWK